MGWGTVALLLVGCAALGALLALAPLRVRTGWLVAAAALAGFLVFLPALCVTAIAASVPYAESDLMDGITSCDTLYGVRLPDWGRLGGDGTGQLLQLVAALLAVTSLLGARRRRRHTDAAG